MNAEATRVPAPREPAMTKSQFWILNAASIVTVALLLTHFFLARHNSGLKDMFAREQSAIENAKQLERVLDQLAKRIAKGSDTDPRLTEILRRYGLNVTLEIDGKKKSYPEEIVPVARPSGNQAW
jgi:hypothetical protein